MMTDEVYVGIFFLVLARCSTKEEGTQHYLPIRYQQGIHITYKLFAYKVPSGYLGLDTLRKLT